jgi:hypothetical protein
MYHLGDNITIWFYDKEIRRNSKDITEEEIVKLLKKSLPEGIRLQTYPSDTLIGFQRQLSTARERYLASVGMQNSIMLASSTKIEPSAPTISDTQEINRNNDLILAINRENSNNNYRSNNFRPNNQFRGNKNNNFKGNFRRNTNNYQNNKKQLGPCFYCKKLRLF